MDEIEHGQAFIVTHDGDQIGEPMPVPRHRRFVTRMEFAAMSRDTPMIDLEAFRADQDATADHDWRRG